MKRGNTACHPQNAKEVKIISQTDRLANLKVIKSPGDSFNASISCVQDPEDLLFPDSDSLSDHPSGKEFENESNCFD